MRCTQQTLWESVCCREPRLRHLGRMWKCGNDVWEPGAWAHQGGLYGRSWAEQWAGFDKCYHVFFSNCWGVAVVVEMKTLSKAEELWLLHCRMETQRMHRWADAVCSKCRWPVLHCHLLFLVRLSFCHPLRYFWITASFQLSSYSLFSGSKLWLL